MFSALIRAAKRWRSVKVTEFERRQMAAVRKEVDQGYEARVDLNAKPSKDAARSDCPAEIRLDLWKRSGHVKVSRVTSTAKSRF
jgi:hypothetical protein